MTTHKRREDTWEAIENECLKMQQALSENQRFLKVLDSLQTNSAPYDGIIGSLAMNIQSFYNRS